VFESDGNTLPCFINYMKLMYLTCGLKQFRVKMILAVKSAS